jgi:hypothetical protein
MNLQLIPSKDCHCIVMCIKMTIIITESPANEKTAVVQLLHNNSKKKNKIIKGCNYYDYGKYYGDPIKNVVCHPIIYF